MSESTKKNPPVLPAKIAGGNPAPGNPAGTQTNLPAGGPVAKSAPVAAPLSGRVENFGGHRGGGKKRADGLIAGTPAAKEEDRKFNALRMFIVRESERRDAGKSSENFLAEFEERIKEIHPANREQLWEKVKSLKPASATLPPPLPRAKTEAENASLPLAANPVALPTPLAGAGVPSSAPGSAFVAWTLAPLLRVTKLVTKIIDRVRVSSLMQRVRKLGLTKEQEKEVEQDFQYKEAAVADFNNAVANAAVIELNKRRVAGAEHSHWLDVVITGGELVSCHLAAVDRLEKLVLKVGEKPPVEQKA
jgi:hypothetical protein